MQDFNQILTNDVLRSKKIPQFHNHSIQKKDINMKLFSNQSQLSNVIPTPAVLHYEGLLYMNFEP